MKLELSLKLRQDVITGFSYSFTKALVEKLKELLKKDNVFVDGNETAKTHDGYFRETEIAGIVTHYLCDQLQVQHSDKAKNLIEVEKLISLAEEFLSIFEEEKADKTISVETVRRDVDEVHKIAGE